MKSKRLLSPAICLFVVWLWAPSLSSAEKVSSLDLDQISAQTNDEDAGEVEEVDEPAEDQGDAEKLKRIQDQMGSLAKALANMPDPPDMSSQILVPLVEFKEKEKKQERG